MNLRKRWTRLLAQYSGRQWATVSAISTGDDRLLVEGYSGRVPVTIVEVKPDDGPVWEMVRAMVRKPESVPAYAFSDAIRDRMEGDPQAERLADMLAAVV